MSDQKTTIGRVVAGVVDVQQTMALQFDSLTKGLEALKLEHQSGISQLREDIRRSDDRSQKQLSDINALHSKELERLHQIIHALLARDASSLGAAAMIPPAQLQQQQQLIMMQRQIDIAHAQAQAHAQNQAMVNLFSAANGAPKQVIPVQQPMSTPAPQLKPQVPTPTAAISILPKATPTAEVTIPTSKPSFPSTTSVAEKQTTSVVIPEKPKNAATPASSGFSFGGTTPTLPIFGKKTEATAVSPAVVPPGDDDDDKEEDYEPEGEFKPVIPLPDLIEVKTGEEEEQAVFTNRAKLYIFANETSEWKERGTGELKVLYNKEKKSWRVVMRREQVLKVCANFPIVGSMSIQQMKSNEKAYTWFCEDFSEDEPAHVKLSARFANVDIATEFKTLFEKAVAEHKSTGTIDKEIKPAEKKTEVKKEIKEEIEIPANKSAVNGFGDKFKQEPGSWECSVCYVHCKPDVDECACCGTSKDGSAKEKNIFSKPSLLQPNPGTPKVTFGFGASAPAKEPVAQTSQFGASLNGSPSTNNSIFGGGTPKGTNIFGGGTTNTPTFSFNKPAAATNATTPSFNFNKPTGSTSSPVPVSSAGNSLFGGGLSKTDSPVATPSFSFSKSSETTATKPTFSFGKQATTASSPAVADDKKSSETPKNVFGSFASGGTTFASLATSGTGSIFDTTNAQKAQQELASQKKTSVFGSKSNTPNTTVTSTSRNDDTEDATEEGDGEYEPEVDFKPVIPLPDLIEVKTGEEDEEVMFTARCKLYKYYSDLQENKERGLGDIKLLKSRDGKYRIVMRREQVHKLCANFRIDKSIKLNPKPNLPNVLTFMCQDFSEDPSNADAAIFTAKFKDEATATAFKTAVQEAQSTM